MSSKGFRLYWWLCAPTGLHGHPADPVELAPPDHQVYPCSFEGECRLQPSTCSVLVLLPWKTELRNIFLSAPINNFCCLAQFFKEANETYTKLQQMHESIRTKYICNKTTPLDNLTELLKNLEVLWYELSCMKHKTHQKGRKCCSMLYKSVSEATLFGYVATVFHGGNICLCSSLSNSIYPSIRLSALWLRIAISWESGQASSSSSWHKLQWKHKQTNWRKEFILYFV